MITIKRLSLIFLCLLLLSSCMKVPEVSNEDIRIELYDASLGELSREEKRNLDFYVCAEFSHPKIDASPESPLEEINQMLKYIPFDLLGYGDYDTQKMVDGELEPLSASEPLRLWKSMESNYNVLHLSAEYLSVEFTGTISNTMRVNTRKCFATFDLSTGKIVSVQDFIGIDAMIEAIKTDAYEVVEGTYLPGGWKGHEPEIREAFIAEISGAISIDATEDHARLVNTDSLYNFGLTEDSVLVKFMFEDSLDGYVVLKFGKETGRTEDG